MYKKIQNFPKKYIYSGCLIGMFLVTIVIPFSSFPSEPMLDDKGFFKLLDPDDPELTEIIGAADKGDIDLAADLWKNYFVNRNWTFYGGEIQADASVIDDADNLMLHLGRETGIYKNMFGRPWQDMDWGLNLNPSEIEGLYGYLRFFHTGVLARAYLANSNESYAWEWVCRLTDFSEDEPMGSYWTTTRTLDTSIRLENWINQFVVFKNSEYCTSRFVLDFCKSIIEQTRYLRDLHSISGNWMVTESQGMILSRGFLPEIMESLTWENEGWESLEDFVREDVHPDGGAKESSSIGYHGVSLTSLTGAFQIADHYPYITPSDYLKTTLAKMAYFALHLKSPILRMYNFGDGRDGGPGMGSVAGAAPYCTESELYDELIYFNTSCVPSGDGLMPKTHIGFPDSGYFITRTNWTEDSLSSVLKAGPMGSGHRHQDVLSFQLYAYGTRFLIDPGKMTYGDNTISYHQKTSWAHSMFVMDDTPTYEVSVDSYTWAAGTYGTAASGTQSYWDADARRELVFAPRGYWLVNDFWEGTGSHSVDLLYQLTDYTNITDISQNIVNTTFNSTTDPNLIMGFQSPWDTRDSVYGGEGTGDRIDWAKISHAAGVWTPGRTIVMEAELNGPSCWSTVLFPVLPNNTFNPTFTPLEFTMGGTTYNHSESFNSPGIATAVLTPEGWDIHISLKSSQTIQTITPDGANITFTGKQCIIQFRNNSQLVESIFSSDIDSLIVNGANIIEKTSAGIESTIDKFTIQSDSIIPITINGTAATDALYDENALTIGGYEL